MKKRLAIILAMTGMAYMSYGVVFTNDLAVMRLDEKGCVVSLKEKVGERDLVRVPAPLVYVACSDCTRSIWPKEMSVGPKDRCVFSFDGIDGKLVCAMRSFGRGWTLSCESCSLHDSDYGYVVLGNIQPVCTKYQGGMLNMYSDEESGVVVRSYDADLELQCEDGCVRARSDLAAASKNPMGRRVGIVAAPRHELVAAMQEMTVTAGVFVSHAGGAWSMGSEANRKSAMFVSPPSEEKVDEWAEALERGGFGIAHLEYWWAGLGHYDLPKGLFPHGLAGMQTFCKKLKDRGAVAGMHTLSGKIDPPDVWIPTRHGEFAKWCSYTLSKPVGCDDAIVFVEECPWDRHDCVFSYGSYGNVLRIGDELLQYEEVSREKPYCFKKVSRGRFGTKKALHSSGEAVDYVHSRYEGFYPAVDKPLAGDLAKIIAGYYHDCEMGEIYLDGCDGFIDRRSQAIFRAKVVEAIGDTDAIVEAAGFSPHSWWHHSRFGAWDYPHWGQKRFHDWHLQAAALARKANLMEGQVGWWCPCLGSTMCRGHYLDDMEYFASRNAGTDSACAICLGPEIRRKPLSQSVERQLTVLGWYERFRRARAFTDEAISRMSKPRAEFRLRQDGKGAWMLVPTECLVHRVSETSSKWTVDVAEAGRAALRVEALYVAAEAVGTNVLEFAEGTILSTCPTRSEVSHRVEFPYPYKSTEGRTAFSFAVLGDGNGALLDFRVNSAREYVEGTSDHYVKVDWKGWRTVTVLLRERDAVMADDLQWPTKTCRFPGDMASHPIFRDGVNVKYISSAEFHLKAAPGKTAKVEVGPVKALPITKQRLENPTLTVNGTAVTVPFILASGERAELEGHVWRHYDENGDLVGAVRQERELPLARGRNEVSCVMRKQEYGAGRAEVTVFAMGRPFAALKPGMTASRNDLLAYEGMMPVVYRPSAGLDGRSSVRVRPDEKAAVEVLLIGPISNPTVTLGKEVRFHSGSLAAGERLHLPPFSPIEGCLPLTVTSSDPASAAARISVAKRYFHTH